MATLSLTGGEVLTLGPTDTPGFFNSGALSGSDDITTAGAALIYEGAASGVDYTYTGTLTGAVNLWHTDGNLEITQITANWAGTLTIQAGNVTFDQIDAFRTPQFRIYSGATLTLNADMQGPNYFNHSINVLSASGTVTISNAGHVVDLHNSITSSGATLAIVGGGTTILSGSNTYAAPTSIAAGTTLKVGAGGTTGTLGNGGAVTDSGALIFDRSNSLTVSNAISSTGTLTQAGTGTTILTGANTYAGTTTISAGTLQIGNGGTAGTLGSGGVTDNAALAFNRTDTVTVANAISGTGTLTHAGTGTTILTATNTYGGTTTISAGTLQVGNGGTTGTLGTGSVTDNATLVFNRSDALTVSSAISGTGKIVQSGTGTTRLATTGTFSGGAEINAGTLDIAAASAAGSGQITFKTGAQTLALESAAFSAGDFANVISSFGAEDTIDLVGISASSTSLGAGNVLSITTTGGTRTIHLDAADSFSGKIFQTSSDGAGGTFLKLATAPTTGALSNPWVANSLNGHDITVTMPGELNSGVGTAGVDTLFYSVMQPLTLPSGVENIVLSGGGGRNIITGNTDDNQFTITSGNWNIDGQSGNDTVVYSHSRDAYTITANGNGYTVTGPDGTQALANIEKLIFSDRRIDIDKSSDANLVFSVYQAAFGRAAESRGEAYWLDWLHSGKSSTDLAKQFIGSSEFLSLYGASTSDAEYITALYQNVLHRRPDASGLSYWTGVLGKESREQMLVDFAASPENQTYVQIFIGQGALVEHALP